MNDKLYRIFVSECRFLRYIDSQNKKFKNRKWELQNVIVSYVFQKSFSTAIYLNWRRLKLMSFMFSMVSG